MDQQPEEERMQLRSGKSYLTSHDVLNCEHSLPDNFSHTLIHPQFILHDISNINPHQSAKASEVGNVGSREQISNRYDADDELLEEELENKLEELQRRRQLIALKRQKLKTDGNVILSANELHNNDGLTGSRTPVTNLPDRQQSCCTKETPEGSPKFEIEFKDGSQDFRRELLREEKVPSLAKRSICMKVYHYASDVLYFPNQSSEDIYLHRAVTGTEHVNFELDRLDESYGCQIMGDFRRQKVQQHCSTYDSSMMSQPWSNTASCSPLTSRWVSLNRIGGCTRMLTRCVSNHELPFSSPPNKSKVKTGCTSYLRDNANMTNHMVYCMPIFKSKDVNASFSSITEVESRKCVLRKASEENVGDQFMIYMLAVEAIEGKPHGQQNKLTQMPKWWSGQNCPTKPQWILQAWDPGGIMDG